MQIIRPHELRKKKRNRKKRPNTVVARTHKGKKVVVKKRDKPPEGCSVAWQICLTCKKTRIKAGSKYHEAKTCKECFI